MIQINKGNEPAAWRKRKRTPGFTEYEPIPELRDALLVEQGYICAYCMRRIPARDMDVDATSKIEHIKSQKDEPGLQLDYSNMAICCPGNLNNQPHCDNLKGKRSVTFNLHTPNLQRSIKYSSKDGDIYSSNAQWHNEMNTMLNLNHAFLKSNRKNALGGVIAAIDLKGWSEAELKKIYHEWKHPDLNGRYSEFCGIVIWYLEKKIRQL